MHLRCGAQSLRATRSTGVPTAVAPTPAVSAERARGRSVSGSTPTGGGAAADLPAARIHDVQGTTRVSPLVGRPVTVPGVVTAVRGSGSARGYWVQDPQPHANPSTSEGLFVFPGSAAPPVAVGDAVTVTGTVAEFRPGGADSADQSTTQLTDHDPQVARIRLR